MFQATPPPPRNNCSQYAPVAAELKEIERLRETQQYAEFFKRVRGDVELCLLQNTVLDTLADDFACMEEEEAIRGHRSGKPINESMSFVDIRHCKEMQVSSLKWHPQHQWKLEVQLAILSVLTTCCCSLSVLRIVLDKSRILQW
jgi:hypothetical protein